MARIGDERPAYKPWEDNSTLLFRIEQSHKTTFFAFSSHFLTFHLVQGWPLPIIVLLT